MYPYGRPIDPRFYEQLRLQQLANLGYPQGPGAYRIPVDIPMFATPSGSGTSGNNGHPHRYTSTSGSGPNFNGSLNRTDLQATNRNTSSQAPPFISRGAGALNKSQNSVEQGQARRNMDVKVTWRPAVLEEMKRPRHSSGYRHPLFRNTERETRQMTSEATAIAVRHFEDNLKREFTNWIGKHGLDFAGHALHVDSFRQLIISVEYVSQENLLLASVTKSSAS